MDTLQDIVSSFYRQQQQNLTVVNDNTIVTTTVTTATAVFICYVIRNMTTNRNKNDPTPTVPYRWPVIGSSAEYFEDKKKFAKEKTELYGPVFRVHLLGQVRPIKLYKSTYTLILFIQRSNGYIYIYIYIYVCMYVL